MDSLKSLDYPSFDVYLVDNGSQRESVNAILNYLNNDSFYSIDLIQNENLSNFTKTNDSNIVFILNENNSGFAGGNNVALNYIKDNVPTGYVMLLNNDTIVTSDLLTGLVTKFNESDDTGFVGANHYYYHDKNRMQTVGGGSIDMVHGECMAITTNGITDEFDFLTGSCILMSCEVLRMVGVLSEDYFMYWEDVDWSTCARNLGYKLRISDVGCIYHKEGASIKSLSRIYYHTRNRILYMKKYTTGLTYYKFIIYIALYVLKESFTNINQNKEYSKTLLKGLKDGLLKVKTYNKKTSKRG
ncbi:MAG: hypothetical protein BZ135_04625 [Methanosphaera sp. rholeuAM6]|nr:MAG: hypothetical protein BZ135_04625 [Methanosphaera sp. rholeuAM6]